MDFFNHADETGGDPFTNIGQKIYQDDSFVKSDPGVGFRSLPSMAVSSVLVLPSKRILLVCQSPLAQKISFLERMYPGFISLPQEIQNEVRMNQEGDFGFVDTIFTHRKIPVPIGQGISWNHYRIQGSGSEMLKLNMVKMSNVGLEPYMKPPIHDVEVLLSAPPEDVKDVMPVLEECMDKQMGIPLPSELEVKYKGTSWAGNIDELSL